MKRLLLPLAALALSACAGTGPEQAPSFTPVDVRGIVIWNHLPYTVRDVMVETPATGRFAGCGNIMPKTKCQTSFPAQQYAGNELLVSWTERGEPQATEPFALKRPVGAPVDAAFWLVVEVFAPGQAGARLAQP